MQCYCQLNPIPDSLLELKKTISINILKDIPLINDEKIYLIYDKYLYIKYKKQEIHFDLLKKLNFYKKQKQSIKNQPLAKALGIVKNKKLTIIDSTCGAGYDSMLMLSWGLKVIAFERNPYIYCLLSDATFRAKINKDITNNFKLHYGDICDNLPKDKYDIIFYDPLFNHKTKAKPKKHMQILREILKNEINDEKKTIDTMTSFAKKLVIKRHINQNFLIKNPHHSYKGKTVRYDMYLF